jgi:hypothetical protein
MAVSRSTMRYTITPSFRQAWLSQPNTRDRVKRTRAAGFPHHQQFYGILKGKPFGLTKKTRVLILASALGLSERQAIVQVTR